LEGSLNPFPINLDLRNKASNLLSVTGDDDTLSSLHVVEDAEETGLGNGCLNCLHKLTSQMTG
jgi:hypothetical protein